MKLLCKKTMPITQGDNYMVALTPGKYYTFDDFFVRVPRPGRGIYDDNGDFWYFSDNAPGALYYTWDYFYTPQEERKVKLEKLNEITL